MSRGTRGRGGRRQHIDTSGLEARFTRALYLAPSEAASTHAAWITEGRLRLETARGYTRSKVIAGLRAIDRVYERFTGTAAA